MWEEFVCKSGPSEFLWLWIFQKSVKSCKKNVPWTSLNNMFFMDVQWNTIFHHVINKQSSKAAAASVKEEGVKHQTASLRVVPVHQPPKSPWKWMEFFLGRFTGSTISTLLHDRINPKDCQVLFLGDTGFLQFFRVVSRDYGKPRFMQLFF